MNIENIHIGDHVAVVSAIGCENWFEHYGGPAEVVGICPPYVAVRCSLDPSQVKTVDTRRWELTKCSEAYVACFAGTTAGTPIEQVVQVVKCGCPVCCEGRFIRVYEKGNEPYWRCSECKSVVVEEGCQT